MIKKYPNLKAMRRSCSMVSEDKMTYLSFVNQVLLIVDIRFKELFLYMFGEGDVGRMISTSEVWNGSLSRLERICITEVRTIILEMHNGIYCTRTCH